jgi:restriction endonuclease S subunit
VSEQSQIKQRDRRISELEADLARANQQLQQQQQKILKLQQQIVPDEKQFTHLSENNYDWKIFPKISSLVFDRMTNGK